MRWSTKKRLEFIESRLFWDGKISRKDLTDYFDISIPQATKDLKQYAELATGNIKYNTSSKHYVVGDDFRNVLTTIDSETYFSQLAISNLEKSGEFFCGTMPISYQLPFLTRSIAPSVLKELHKCMNGGFSVEIEYQSMNTPDPTRRMVSPHALGFDGIRWHIRALCHKSKIYKDFVLSRITATGETREFPHGHSNDYLWHNNIVFKIAPHNDLSPGQKQSVEREYNMINGEVSIEVKAAFYFYLIERLGLHAENEKIEGKRQQIILKNREEIVMKINLLQEIESTRIKELSL
jgi:hypothetical protein